MVLKNKWIAIFYKYRKLIKKRLQNTSPIYIKKVRRGNKTKNKILDFYLRNNRWPERKSVKKIERRLGTCFENYISKLSGSFDKELRDIVMSTGRVSNNKCKHDVARSKKDILTFLKEHGRVPSTSYEFQTIKGEANLRRKLDYYTKEKNDMTLLGQIYNVDKCHLSGIQVKYRRIINEQLDIEKPLVRLIK